MGTSVLLVFVAPIMIVYLIFTNIYAFITGEKTELVLPYDESKGIIWEYEADEDYYVNLVETKIKGDKQIFVFQDCKSNTDDEFVGAMMDLVFTDKNGNTKKFYACSDNGHKGPYIFEEDECLLTEYTVTAQCPKEGLFWKARQETTSVLIQPRTYDTTVTFTIIYTPQDSKEDGNPFDFTPMFYYTDEDGGRAESVAVVYKPVNGKLEIVKQSYDVPHPPTTQPENG